MSNELIFITGVTGFIGSATAVKALQAGYRLRICLRKPSQQVENLLSDYSGQVEYVIVPDLTDETGFDGKLNGVDYVLHIASPLPQGGTKETYFAPAVKGTISLLKAAAKVSSIKKVVVTSSFTAFFPVTGIPPGGVIKEDNDWDYSIDENETFDNPQNPVNRPMQMYMASKLVANKETWHFKETTNPPYALVTLHPSYVYGHSLLPNPVDGGSAGSNVMLWELIMKGDISYPGTTIGTHITDVAEAHIKALDPKIADGSKYFLAGPKTSGADIARILNRLYPDLKPFITEDTHVPEFLYDSTKAETDLGIQWRSFEEMLKEMMDQQLGLT